MSNPFDSNQGWDPVTAQDAPGNDQVSETTSKSWFQRIREALGGILTGLALLLGAVILLFVNEGRAVKTANALKEGAGLVVEASASKADPALDGKLIHVAGRLTVTAPPRDSDFDLSAPGLRLERKVEMFQWREKSSTRTEKHVGGREETVTTYSYVREWSENDPRGDSFKQPQGHANPPLPFASKTFSAPASLGAYQLAGEQTRGLGKSAPFAPEARQVQGIASRLNRPARLLDGKVVVAYDPTNPQVGDLRLSYELARTDEASVVAAQKGAALLPYAASNGRSIFLARDGVVPAAAMFERAQEDNALITWLLRGLGLILCIVGFRLILKIATVLADVVPLFGNIVGFGVGIVAALLGGALAALVSAMAWIYYRPLLGIGLLLVALACLAFVVMRARGAAPAPAGRAA